MRTEFTWIGHGSHAHEPTMWRSQVGNLIVECNDDTSRPWVAYVDNVLLVSRTGSVRKFKTAHAAQRAAMLGYAHDAAGTREVVPF